MDLLGTAIRGAREAVTRANPTNTFGDSSILPNSVSMGLSGSGMVLTKEGALAISTVLNCVKVLHDDLGILPFVGYSGERFGYKSALKSQPQIVAEPFGPDLSVPAGMGQIVVSLKMRGNAYLYVAETDRRGYPNQLVILNPDQVQVKRTDDGKKRFKINGELYGPDEIKHITGLMLPGGMTGIDPISYQRVTLGLAADVNQYGANFFRNGGSPSGVISVPGPGGRKEAREVKEAWENGHSGVVNAHRPAVMFGGAVWQQLSVAPENAQFLQTRAFLREEICGWYGVPLDRIMAIVDKASQGGGKGMDAREQGYVTHTLLPITTAIEGVWKSFLPGGQSTWALFDFAGLLRASALERAQISMIDRTTGRRSRDELRAEEGWAPIGGPDGENYNIPLNSNTGLPVVVEPGETAPPVSDPTSPTTGDQP